MTLRLAALALFLLAAPAAWAQPPCPACTQARADVDTLASPRYAGRGYDARRGADQAAQFVQRRFHALGLRPVGSGTYLHPFGFAAPQIAAAGLTVDGRTLRMGTEALPLGGPATSGFARLGSRRGQVAVLAPDSLDARVARAAARGAVAAVVPHDALPAYGSVGFTPPIPVFSVRREAWPSRGQRVRFRLDAVPPRPHAGQNVLGAVRGTAVPDSFLVVTAHYDHVGCFRDAIAAADVCFPGANDNASGTALLLALAEQVAAAPLRYTVVFAALGGEETGLHGSTALAAAPPWPLARTRFLVNLDMAASGAGLMAFGGTDFAPEFARLNALAAARGLPAVTPRGMRPNSDQYPFFARGVRAFYLLTSNGAQPYHHPHDVPETLDWEAWARLNTLSHAFLHALAGGVAP